MRSTYARNYAGAKKPSGISACARGHNPHVVENGDRRRRRAERMMTNGTPQPLTAAGLSPFSRSGTLRTPAIPRRSQQPCGCGCGARRPVAPQPEPGFGEGTPTRPESFRGALAKLALKVRRGFENLWCNLLPFLVDGRAVLPQFPRPYAGASAPSRV